MLFCKFTKVDTAVYISHLDMLRAITMGIRRKRLNIEFSEGFNPHPRIFFNQPIPVGLGSECEYFFVESNENCNKFKEELNKSLPNGFKILDCVNVDKNPNIANAMHKAKYVVEFEKDVDLSNEIEIINNSTNYEIEFMQKGELKKKDIKEMVFSIEKISNKEYLFLLSCGNINLRADRLVDFMLKQSKSDVFYNITKKELFNKDNISFDDLFFKIVK